MFSPRSCLLLAITLIAAVGFSMSPCFARGGRGGDGRSAGGERAAGAGGPSRGVTGNSVSRNPAQAGNSPRNLSGTQQLQGGLQQAGQGGLQQRFNGRVPGSQNRQGTFQPQATQFQQRTTIQGDGHAPLAAHGIQQYQSGPANLTPSYANHPRAAQYAHPHADAAFVATAANVTAWTDPAYYVPIVATENNTTEVYQEYPTQATNPTGSPSDIPANLSADTIELMPLGIYSLATNQNTPSTLTLQLSVDRVGQLRGSYSDSVTNTTHNVAGTLNRTTQLAQWSLENNPQVTFQAPLNELLQPTGMVQVNLPTGAQQWQIMRVEQE